MTELIWDGKYDKDGKRVAPVRIALPDQPIETINEFAQVRAYKLTDYRLLQYNKDYRLNVHSPLVERICK